MTRPPEKSALWAILAGLGWPLFLGSWACAMFYGLIFWGPLKTELVLRYFAGFWISEVATWMFFVGLASLGFKLVEIFTQEPALRKIRLPLPEQGDQQVEEAGDLIDYLESLPARMRNSYFGRRLHDALEYVERKRSPQGVEEELKYYADNDAARQQESYALVRIITWATPMLGFLGTVIGITMALGGLDAEKLDSNFQDAISGLLSGLYVAFDTTALALSLSILLMFVWFLIDRLETQLLERVDVRANEEIVGRFAQIGSDRDPHLASVERMCVAVMRATEQLMQRQNQLWQSTAEAVQQQWGEAIVQSGQRLQASLSTVLAESLDRNAAAIEAQQLSMVRQADTLSQAVKAAGEVAGLETALNNNLNALAGAKHFEEAVNTLTAATHLLVGRLGQATSSERRVDLQSGQQERAA
ncbi:MotA/TolQ/ExbB proton channel family protein [Lignipirellula cremea]|uniref:MotA/TolQ/ExbB proton channel family protein n=1 Tax=Lignipirellula cremea TaxID=2528010 RepID=A0A518DUE9_9BACT|nr:MotA/TolQ/ExbB proton channel family protein [Lignipirellula cremea]QDU95463.1 MotA/TolQ/ExbB proton channel family protein [Lignipirellula cremea]